MNKISTLLFLFIFFSITLTAQNTVGLLSYDPAKTFDGYNLVYPHNQPNVFLLDNCGQIVHTWQDSTDFRPGNMSYLMPDGKLVKTKRPSTVAGNPIWAGGGGGTVEIRDWDNNLEWSFTQNDSLARLHHDIAVMPNGNILMVSWELKSQAEAIQAGRDTALLSQAKLWPDYILEVDPTTDQVVWEWHVWDHLVQDYDATKDNYGVVADHPELVNLNYDTNDGKADWMHVNALDYNADLDQIMICVPTFHEIWIIDHSTTTAEAAGHFGGMSGKGGDLLYRWGNPATYNAGDTTDQKLFYPHDAHWVDRGLNFMHPDFGKIAIFNNRVSTDVSTVNIFNSSFDMYKWSYPKNTDNTFLPTAFDWTYTHPMAGMMHSTGLSSIQVLPNNNRLICVGRFGYTFEITPDEEIVWEYKTPTNGPTIASQGDTLAINNNLTFRFNRYPTDYQAFEDKDLSPQGYWEMNPNPEFCSTILSTENIFEDKMIKIYPNPASNHLVLEWEGGRQENIQVFDLMGQRIESLMGSGGRKFLDIANWNSGIYFVRVGNSRLEKIIVTK